MILLPTECRSLSLWSIQKKKPIFTQAVAHGMDESHVETEDIEIVRKPRWITAVASLHYSDLFASGAFFPLQANTHHTLPN